jgi:hypothetical protein
MIERILDAFGIECDIIEDIIPISDLDELHIQLPEAAVAPEGGRVIEHTHNGCALSFMRVCA